MHGVPPVASVSGATRCRRLSAALTITGAQASYLKPCRKMRRVGQFQPDLANALESKQNW